MSLSINETQRHSWVPTEMQHELSAREAGLPTTPVVPWEAPHPHSAPPTHTRAWGPCSGLPFMTALQTLLSEKLEKLTNLP